MWEKSCRVFFTGNLDEWCSWGWQKGMCIPEKAFYISFAVSQIRPHFTACWMCVWSSKYSCVCPKYVGAYLWVCLSFSLSVCVSTALLFQHRETEKLFCGQTCGAAEWSLVIGSVYLHKPGFVIRSSARRDKEQSQTHFNSHKMSNQHHPSLFCSYVPLSWSLNSLRWAGIWFSSEELLVLDLFLQVNIYT